MNACRIAFVGAWRGARCANAALTAPAQRHQPPTRLHGRRPPPGARLLAHVVPSPVCYAGKDMWEA